MNEINQWNYTFTMTRKLNVVHVVQSLSDFRACLRCRAGGIGDCPVTLSILYTNVRSNLPMVFKLRVTSM